MENGGELEGEGWGVREEEGRNTLHDKIYCFFSTNIFVD